MTFDEYQQLARRTITHDLAERERLTMTALGLVGEAGECSEIVKKHVFHQHPLDRTALEKELGDVLWYVAMLADTCGLSLDDVVAHNIAKLLARYPDGFSAAASQTRPEGE